MKAEDAEQVHVYLKLYGAMKHARSLRDLLALSIGRKRKAWVSEILRDAEARVVEI